MIGGGIKTSETESDKFEVEIKDNVQEFLKSMGEPFSKLEVSRYEESDTKFYSDIMVTNPKNDKNVWIEVKKDKYACLGGPSMKFRDGRWECTTTEEEHLSQFYVDAITKGAEKFISFCKSYLKTDDINIPKDLSPELISAWKRSGSVDDTDNDVQFITDKIPLDGFGERIAEYYKTAKYEPVYYIQVGDDLYIVDPEYNPLGLRTKDGKELKSLADAYRLGRIQFRAKGLDKKLKGGKKYYYSIVCDVKILADDSKGDEPPYECSFKSRYKFPTIGALDGRGDGRTEGSKMIFESYARIILEDWMPEYDKKPVNQWGERWFEVPHGDAIFEVVNEIAKDCCSDPDLDHMPDTIHLSSLHRVEGGHYIATVFGGCNGGCDPRKTIVYLSVVKKFAKKLLEAFGDVWLVDWKNDCLDDVWTVRIAFSDKDMEEYAEIEKVYDAMFAKQEENGDIESVQNMERVGPEMAVDILAELTGGNALHEAKRGFTVHSLELAGDIYRFTIVRRTWKNLVVYKNDEQEEFFAFDGNLDKTEFLKQAKGFLEKIASILEDGNTEARYVDKISRHEMREIIDNKDYQIDEAESEIGGEKSDTVPTAGKKLWIDDIRKAPEGFIWLKSVNDFIDWCYRNGGMDDVSLIDTDHDAGDFQPQGGDYIRCFDYLEACGCQNILVHIHSANPVGANNIRRIISRNKERGWREIRNS